MLRKMGLTGGETMIRGVPLAILAITLAVFSPYAEAGNLSGPQFAPGQEWSVKSGSPTTAMVIVGRVEPWGNTECVSVSIVDIPIPRGLSGAGGITQIAHIPFDKAALAASVDRLLATGISPAPSFESGYKQWQDAKGGIYAISVEKAIEIMFQTINRQQG